MPGDPLQPGQLDSFVNAAVSLLGETLYDPEKLQRLQRVIENGVSKGSTVAAGAVSAAQTDALSAAETTKDLLEQLSGAVGGFAMAFAVENTFDVDVSQADFVNWGAKGNRLAIARKITEKMIGALTGGNTSMEPSADPAARYLNVVLGQALESWAIGTLVEIGSAAIPFLDQIQTVGDIGNKIANVLGFSDSSSRVLRPYIDNLVVEPLRRHIDSTYRPTLLAPASVLRQFMRGRWAWEDAVKELAHQGYSDERINALLNEQRKFFSAADVRTFVDREHWTKDQGYQHLRDQGYDENGAVDSVRLEGLHRIDQLESQEAALIIGAYTARDIDRVTFAGLLDAHVKVATERALFTEIGDLRRALNIKHLSSSEVAAAVQDEILAFIDYREALAREGYTDQAILVKELMLRVKIDADKTIEEHRAAAEAERAAEKAARAAAAAAKRAELEADRALRRRGAAGDLERAVIRGLIPIARYAEVLSAAYDADTVSILVALVEDDRQNYLAQQQRAAEAAQRATRKGLDVGALSAAVLTNVLTIDEFGRELRRLGFADADADILTATLTARKADLDEAKAQRARASELAKRRTIDLGRFEQLVRRGSRTMAEYERLLETLGFDEASRAGMVELLDLHIADDAAAADARARADATARPGELTIAEFRRAVVLGLKTLGDFDVFLTSRGVTADKHALLAAELRDDVDQAEAARQRRAEADARLDTRGLQLALVRRAARLGIVTVATYQARLAQAGWTDDDIAIETDLLLAEISDVQAARAQRTTIERELVAKGLSLADTARAVKAGVVTLETYQAKAIELGVSPADVATLTRVLADELRETQAAKVRRTEIASELDAKKYSLALLDDQVRGGTLTIDDYIGELTGLGYALDDAELLATLLLDELEAAPSAP